LASFLQPYLPSPVGLWPLSKAVGPADISASNIPGNESWVAYDPLYTSAGLIGSPMFTKELQHKSFIQIFPSSKLSTPTSKQITILGWIRPDALNEGTVLVNYIEKNLIHILPMV
jgi:hypothetical protein